MDSQTPMKNTLFNKVFRDSEGFNLVTIAIAKISLRAKNKFLDSLDGLSQI